MTSLIFLLCLVGIFIGILVIRVVIDTGFDSIQTFVSRRFGPTTKTWMWTIIGILASAGWAVYILPEHLDELRIWRSGGTTIHSEGRRGEGTIVSRSLRDPFQLVLGTVCGLGFTAMALTGLCFIIRRKTFYDSNVVLPRASTAPIKDPQYYLLIGDSQSGPYNISQLRLMWHNGHIPEDADYCFPGASQWQPIRLLSQMLSKPSNN